MINIEPPFYPIIYVRGYASSESEVEDTVADPYMGFNLGSTKLRQLWTGAVTRHYFESPLVRLMKDHGYRDAYQGGREMPPGVEISPRSVFIYRYYDIASSELGPGTRKPIEFYAQGLGDYLLKVRDAICGQDTAARRGFRVYLVAHSMGGLVCRCLLQNPGVASAEARGLVEKVFTYATPHNGIDLQFVGNIPGFATYHEADTFNRDRMRKYLALPAKAERADDLNGKFDPDRFFCLVGTNERDYAAGFGLARKIVGPMSDGLVRIANATVFGRWTEGSGSKKTTVEKSAPRAFIHRSHSGHYGVVNSEEGYQNLTRFLFGTMRVDGELEVHELTLPPKVQEAYDQGHQIRASYHFEVVVRVRGALWDLHRRICDENSAIFRTFDEMFPRRKKGAPAEPPRHPLLFSSFLDARQRVNKARPSLGFSVDLGVMVPQYEVDGLLWFDDHYQGGYLYRDKINLEAVPPDEADPKSQWVLYYGCDSKTPNRTSERAESARVGGDLVFRVPVEQATLPGMRATLLLTARPWNSAP